MFIELHTRAHNTLITINMDMIQYFKPADSGEDYTIIGVANQNGNIFVTETYSQIKELIKECQKK